MLTDAALKFLKPKDKPYKVTDRDGMYVLVSCGGTISFRLDYRLNGRRETVSFGKYGPSGLSLARAREKCIDAKRLGAARLEAACDASRVAKRSVVVQCCLATLDRLNRGAETHRCFPLRGRSSPLPSRRRSK